MSRPTSEWTASMKCATDHPEIRKLYAHGGGVAQEWLADQIVKHCSIHGLKDGRVTLADIKSAVAGKVSRPTLTKYIDDLVACDALKRVGKNLFHSRLAERICSSFNGRGNKSVRPCKNSFTPQNAFFRPENGCEVKSTWPRTVPDLEKDLSQRLKADATTSLSATVASATVAVESPPAPRPVALLGPVAALAPVAAEVKSHVARQAGLRAKQGSSVADTFLSMGMFASGKSIADLQAMQYTDLDDLDTEAILAQDRQEAALLRPSHPSARKKPAKAHAASPPTGVQAGHKGWEPASGPQTRQRLPASVIRHTLGQVVEAIPEFVFGEREVNALRQWPVTEAQLVDLKNTAVARKRQGKLTTGVGAYLYGAVRKASLGVLPTRRGVGPHLAGASSSEVRPPL